FGPRLYCGLGDNCVSIVPLLLTGPLLLLNLYQYPGGTAEVMFERRDNFLRWVAKRHNLLVPSLIADRRIEDENLSGELVIEAERNVEEVAAASGAAVVCPVCEERLTLAEAAEHEHLRVKETELV